MDSSSIVNEGGASSGSNSKSESPMDPDLFKAAAEGKIKTFHKLKAQHVELEQIATQTFKDTILHINIKCQKGRNESTDQNGRNESTDQNGRNESTEFVNEILRLCPSLLLKPNAKGDTPLHVAVKCKQNTIVKVLIQHAKGKEKEIESGLRPEWEMLKLTNNDKNTALHEAIIFGSLDVVNILTKEGDPDFPYSANNLGETPLYLAANREDEGMVDAILESCRSAAHEGPHGKTAMHAAAKSFHFGKPDKIIEIKKSLTKETDEHGWTPLHYAAYYGYFAYNAKILLESDRSSAYVGDTERSMTALHLAAGQGNLETIKEIISQCPECYELVDNRGWNVLHFAMISLKEVELKELLENPLVKSLINEKDDKGNTPLHVLAAATTHKTYFEKYLVLELDGYVEAVNKQNASVRDIYRRGCPELEQEIQELSKDVGKGQQYPNGVIRKSEKHKKDEDVDDWKETTQAHLVVATLIATVTFAAAFTVPGGYNSEKDSRNPGTAILSKNSAFQAFIIADTIAMTLSLSAVFIHIWMSIKNLRKSEDLFNKFLIATLILTVLAMGAMMVAFVTGTYAVLAPSLGLAITTCLIGLIFFLLVVWAIRSIVKDILAPSA